jgi:hypothetical protein
MPKKLTITVEVSKDLEVAYLQMAQDETRETVALEWAEATVGDVADETR